MVDYRLNFQITRSTRLVQMQLDALTVRYAVCAQNRYRYFYLTYTNVKQNETKINNNKRYVSGAWAVQHCTYCRSTRVIRVVYFIAGHVSSGGFKASFSPPYPSDSKKSPQTVTILQRNRRGTKQKTVRGNDDVRQSLIRSADMKHDARYVALSVVFLGRYVIPDVSDIRTSKKTIKNSIRHTTLHLEFSSCRPITKPSPLVYCGTRKYQNETEKYIK